MPVFAVVAAAAGGGRYIPDKPDISHYAYGQFKINNYSPNYIYTISLNSGSGTCSQPDSSGIITFSATTASFNVVAKSVKGLTNSLATTAYRQEPTVDKGYVQTSWGIGSCLSCSHSCPECCGCGCEGACTGYGNDQCGISRGYTTCTNHDYSGSGYISAYGEWGRVS